MKIADIFAKFGIKADSADMAKTERRIKKFRDKQAKGFAKLEKSITQKLAGLGLGFAAIAETKKTLEFEKSLGALEIASDGALGKLDQMRSQFIEISNETGLAKEEILAGAGAFVKLTGDGAEAAKVLDTVAKTSLATGSSLEETGLVAATLNKQFGIEGRKNMEAAFSILIRGGKAGAVEFNEMSSIIAKLAPQFSRFSGSEGTEGIATLNALLQQTRGAFGSTAEAGTGLQRLIANIAGKASDLEAAGIQVFTGEVDENGIKKMRGLVEILRDMFASDLGKDIEEFNKVMGKNIIPQQAFLQLQKTAGGFEGLRAEMNGATDAADDFAKISQNRAVRVSKAWNKFKNELIPVFETVVDFLAFLADNGTAVKNVLTALAVAFAAVKLKAVAAAVAAKGGWLAALGPIGLVAAGAAAIASAFGIDVVGAISNAAKWVMELLSDSKKLYDFLGITTGKDKGAQSKGSEKEFMARQQRLARVVGAERAAELLNLETSDAAGGLISRHATKTINAALQGKGNEEFRLEAFIKVDSDANAPEAARAVRKEMENFWGEKIREVQSAMAQGSR